MIFIVTASVLINLSLIVHQTSSQNIDTYNSAKQYYNTDPMWKHPLKNSAQSSSSSSSSDSSSSGSSSTSEEDLSNELKLTSGKQPNDVLALIVVDNPPRVLGRRGKLLEPYESLTLPQPQPYQRRLDEQNTFTKLRNNNQLKTRPVNRKGEPKELFNNDPKLQKSDLQKALQRNPNVEEFLSKPNEGLDIAPFPDVQVLPLPLSWKSKDSKPNLSNQQAPNQGNSDPDKTYTVKKDQLLALRARWSKKCDKAAAKQCKKACKRAMKYACSDYKCRRGLKKSFKKECKRSCKSRFISRGGCR